jgi:hypothetical protein
LVTIIGADTGELDGALKGVGSKLKALGGEAAAFGGKLSTIALGVAAGGVVALGAGLVSCAKEAMEAQTGFAQLDAVIKSTGGVAGVTAEMAKGLADSLQGVTRFADDTIIAGENMLLTFTNIGKDVFPQATETMLDMSQALGQDLTASAMQLGKALNDPIQGVTALRRVGVQLTDEQEALIKAMVESGDVMGAQKIILAELTREFGGSAKAAGETLPGQLDILRHKFDDVKETIGNSILPIFTKFTGFVMKKMPDITKYVDTKLVPAIKNIGNAFEWLAKRVEGWGFKSLFTQFEDGSSLLEGFFEQLGMDEGKARSFADAILDTIRPIRQAIEWLVDNKEATLGALGGIVAALGAFMAFSMVAGILTAIANPITVIIGLAALLGAAWGSNFGGIQEKTAAMWAVVKPIFEDTKKVLGEVWDIVKDGIQPGDVEALMAIFSDLGGRLKDWAANIDWQGIVDTLNAKFEEARKAADDQLWLMGAQIGYWARNFDWQGLLDTFNKKLFELSDDVLDWANSEDTKSKMADSGTAIGTAVGEGLKAAFKLMVAEIGSWYSQGGFKEALKIQETMADISGEMTTALITGFIEGITGWDISPKIVDWLRDRITFAFRALNPGSLIWQLLMDEIENIKELFAAISFSITWTGEPPPYPGRDLGGDVEAGHPYWIGLNRQPELFIPGQSGTVIAGRNVNTGYLGPTAREIGQAVADHLTERGIGRAVAESMMLMGMGQ